MLTLGVVLVQKRALSPRTGQACVRLARLRGFGDGFVHQHDWNVVPHRVDAVALCALQAFSRLFTMQQRLFARRADQDVEQILRNHADILPFFQVNRCASALEWRISGCTRTGEDVRAYTGCPAPSRLNKRLHWLGEERPH
jgi:hypothetical protein